MSWHSIIDGTVILYSWIDREVKQKVHVCAKLPNHDLDNMRIDLLDWKIDKGGVDLTYRFSPYSDAAIHDARLPVVIERIDIPKPNKSKNWELMEYEDAWKNKKTGKKVWI